MPGKAKSTLHFTEKGQGFPKGHLAGEWGDKLRTWVFISVVDSWDEGLKMEKAACVHCFLACVLSCQAQLAAMGHGLRV